MELLTNALSARDFDEEYSEAGVPIQTNSNDSFKAFCGPNTLIFSVVVIDG
jgi:hypothetical protein